MTRVLSLVTLILTLLAAPLAAEAQPSLDVGRNDEDRARTTHPRLLADTAADLA
jgi:hypothetical protein